MNWYLVVVLVVGLAVLTSFKARRRGYSRNQRIVLSGIAIVLLLAGAVYNGGIAEVMLAVVGTVVLICGTVMLRKSG